MSLNLKEFSTQAYRSFRRLYSLSKINCVPVINSSLKLTEDLTLKLLEKSKKINLPPDEYWGFGTKVRFLLGWYESETVKVCNSLIKPGMKALDIGAHCGYFTRLFSELVGPTGMIYAFEPHPQTFQFLSQNISYFKHKNVMAVPKAASDRQGEVEFFEMSASGKHSLYNVSSYLSHFTLQKKMAVQSTTIDQFLAEQGNPKIDFVKMDIEGGEPKALRGMEQTIKNAKNLAMITEFNPAVLEAGGTKPEQFLKQLQLLGFTVNGINADGTLLPMQELVYPTGPCDWYINLICIKNDLQ